MNAELLVIAARLIRPYVAPQYLVEPIPSGEAVEDDLDAINGQGYDILADDVQGWGDFNATTTAIIRVYDTDAPEADGNYYVAWLA